MSRYRKWIIAGFFIIGTALLARYCSGTDVLNAHARICRESATVVVDNSEIWGQYRHQAELAFQARRLKWGPETGRVLFEPVEGFTRVYGESRDISRPNAERKVVRNDIILLKGDIKVAHLVDFIAKYETLGSRVFLTCVSLPDLYKEAM
jgi:hypothetical protein